MPAPPFPQDYFPQDMRTGPLRTLDDSFPLTPIDSSSAWDERAEQLRRGILVATGLWPLPTPASLNAVIHGLVDRGEYTVEKMYFESYPRHFVTGNLYRPVQRSGGRPGVLSPHGHWEGGRYHDHGPIAVRTQIITGAEQLERGGRHPLQARCVQLARMGCVVFLYDMVGY